MKKTQLIKNIIGKELETYGFKYLKTEGPMRIFVREVTGKKRYYDPENDVVKQYINVQESHYAKELIVRFSTDAYGSGSERELEQIRDYTNGNPWLEYTDGNSYKEALKLLADLIQKYGIELLNEMSVEEEIIPTKSMALHLFRDYKKLDEEFINRFQFKKNPEQVEDIDEWYKRIKEVILQVAEEPYEEVKELLTQMAAFIGERARDILRQKWDFSEHFQLPRLGGVYPYSSFSPLDIVVELWKNNCDEKQMFWFNRYINTLKQGFLKNELMVYE